MKRSVLEIIGIMEPPSFRRIGANLDTMPEDACQLRFFQGQVSPDRTHRHPPLSVSHGQAITGGRYARATTGGVVRACRVYSTRLPSRRNSLFTAARFLCFTLVAKGEALVGE
jgi:hypothetical protein